MHRFFVEESSINQSRVVIRGSDAHHIADVLRMKIGEEIHVCTGDEWEYTCEISAVSKEEVVATVVDASKPGKELASSITLYQCLPKKDKMELIIQKAVELGATRIVPVESSRVVVHLDKKREPSRVERWNKVAEAAAKQSGRMVMPVVSHVLSYIDALNDAADLDVRLIPYEKYEDMNSTREIVSDIRPGQSVGVIIGPEGGFEEAEFRKAREKGFEPVSLGRRILRTETAGMFMLSVLGFMLDGRGE